MHANDETGWPNPNPNIASLCGEPGVLVHTDAAQSVGKIPVQVGSRGWISSGRPGTANVPGIVGLGAACALAAVAGLQSIVARVRSLRDRLHQALATAVADLVLPGIPGSGC